MNSVQSALYDVNIAILDKTQDMPRVSLPGYQAGPGWGCRLCKPVLAREIYAHLRLLALMRYACYDA